MTNAFKLNNIYSKNKYNKGVAATVRYDQVDLGKPGPEDWFKLYKMGDNLLQDYQPAMVSKVKDPEGYKNPYLVYGDETFKVPKEKVFEEPPIDYETAINKAFKNRVINSPDHPVYRNAGTVLETQFQKKVMKGVIKS